MDFTALYLEGSVRYLTGDKKEELILCDSVLIMELLAIIPLPELFLL